MALFDHMDLTEYWLEEEKVRTTEDKVVVHVSTVAYGSIH